MSSTRTKQKKTRIISMRMTEAQFQYLNGMIKRIQTHTTLRPTRTSIIIKLMQYGFPKMESDFPKLDQVFREDSEDEENLKAG